MRLALLLSMVAVAGCASTPEPFTGPNGRTAYSLSCNRLGYCYEKASNLCPKGYDSVGQGSRFAMLPNGMAATRTSLTIECR